jgi:hypothetical protein
LGVGKEGGRPPHVPTDQTRRLVEMMSGVGVPQMHVALFIGISDETLRKHYRRELDLGAITANAKVAEALYRLAVGGDVTAAIWWSKCRMGWRERQAIEHSGSLSLGVFERRAGIENKGSECATDSGSQAHW